MGISQVIEDILGGDLPIRLRAWDGSEAGSKDSSVVAILRSPDAVARLVRAPNGQLGVARAFVSGDLEIDGDIYDLLPLRKRIEALHLSPANALRVLRHVGPSFLRRLPLPPEEVRLGGRLHSKNRDAAAISHHYDVSNEFYRLVLGPSLTYSCAVWHDASHSLEQAQDNKYELICRKLSLQPGQRLLDIGCGWGGMLIHAARHYGVEAVGVTISGEQADLAKKRVVEAGLDDRVEIRLQDYRDVSDGPYDAISSIGMFEHVGSERLGLYFDRLFDLLRPEGRLLNHAISRPHLGDPALPKYSFVNRYVFPDGALHEVGGVVSALHGSTFEVRHVENLREHYALTLRHWVRNLQNNWAGAVAEVGEGRARVWLLYMSACAVQFEENGSQIHQTLAVRPAPGGASGIPLRPRYESDRG